MTVLIVAEKPSAARNMAAALGGMSGAYEGVQYEVIALRGHLYEFAEPHEQVPPDLVNKYKYWELGNLPWDPAEIAWKRKPKEGTAELLADLAARARAASEVVVATDVDPSGEGGLLFAEPMLELGITPRRLTRMYFTDESATSIQKAFVERKEIVGGIENFEEYRKALSRSKLDWLSQQFTRVASITAGQRTVLKQGRLKSAMLLLVGEQLKAHLDYVKRPYFQTRFRDENGVMYTDPDEPKHADRAAVPPLTGSSAVLVESRTDKRVAPPRLLDLAGLSSRLSGKGVKAETVLSTYQRMYEDQVVSYPRTEDKTITTEQFNDLLPLVERIAAVAGVDLSLLTVREPRRTHVKNTGAHGANRPGLNVPASLAEVEQKYGEAGRLIYEELARSFLGMLAEDYVYESQQGRLADYPSFTGSAAVPKALGWKQVFNEDTDDEKADDDGQAENTVGLGTQAAPFVFEGVNKRPEHPTMKWLMKQLEKRDVGTGATRTSTYAEVTREPSQANKYPLMSETKGKVTLTEFGQQGYRLLPNTRIGDLGLTEYVYEEMRQVAAGTRTVDDVIGVVAGWVVEDIATMKTNAATMRRELGLPEPQPPKERYEGAWAAKGGRVVRFARVWSGHRFTDTECAALLAGEEITFTTVSEKKKAAGAADPTFTARGRLVEETYKGKKIVGFKADYTNRDEDGNEIPPTSWCFHVFTEAERQTLIAGGEVTANDFVGKSKKRFTATLRFAKKGGRKTIVARFR